MATNDSCVVLTNAIQNLIRTESLLQATEMVYTGLGMENQFAKLAVDLTRLRDEAKENLRQSILLFSEIK